MLKNKKKPQNIKMTKPYQLNKVIVELAILCTCVIRQAARVHHARDPQ